MYCMWSRRPIPITCHSLLQVESKSAATDLEARAILHLQQLGLARVLNLRVGGRAR